LHASFALYLARRGKARESVEQIGLAGSISEEIKREVIAALVERGAFSEARLIWAGTNSSEAVQNGGFEAPLSLQETGFGWRVAREIQGAQLSLDTEAPHEGSKSLRVEYNGDSNPQTPLLTQLVVVEPNTVYGLTFVERAESLVTGGPPIISVLDASDKKLLAKSPILGKQPEWNLQTLEITTGLSTKAVVITLQRENCSTGPCPAFGTFWLDNIQVKKLRIAH
jgi:hypothetical protein